MILLLSLRSLSLQCDCSGSILLLFLWGKKSPYGYSHCATLLWCFCLLLSWRIIKVFSDWLVAKKTIFNFYDNYHKIKGYNATRKLTIPKTKVNPWGCAMQGSFGFCTNWFNYIKKNEFVDKKVNKNKDYVYDISDCRGLWRI